MFFSITLVVYKSCFDLNSILIDDEVEGYSEKDGVGRGCQRWGSKKRKQKRLGGISIFDLSYILIMSINKYWSTAYKISLTLLSGSLVPHMHTFSYKLSSIIHY